MKFGETKVFGDSITVAKDYKNHLAMPTQTNHILKYIVYIDQIYRARENAMFSISDTRRVQNPSIKLKRERERVREK